MATQFTSGEQERIARMIKRNIVSHPDFNGSIPENRYVVKEVSSENMRLSHIKSLRGKYKSRLTSSEVFAENKIREIELEG